MTLYHISIEAMQGLTECHHDVVGDIDDIVDRTQTNGGQLVLQPLRRLLDLTVGNADTSIALAGLGVLNNYIDGEAVVINGERRCTRLVGSGLIAVLLQPGIQVARYTPMAQRISTVGGDVNLDEPVALQMVTLRHAA